MRQIGRTTDRRVSFRYSYAALETIPAWPGCARDVTGIVPQPGRGRYGPENRFRARPCALLGPRAPGADTQGLRRRRKGRGLNRGLFSMPCRYTRTGGSPRGLRAGQPRPPLCPHAGCRAFTPRPRRYILPTGISTVIIPEVISGACATVLACGLTACVGP